MVLDANQTVIAGSGFSPTNSATFQQAGRGVLFSTTVAFTGNLTTNFIGDAVILNCDVWSEPSRIVLQVILLLMLFVNIAASVIVFSISTNVRGKHVSFLFGCVRTLNLLDILQCVVLFLFPIFMPGDCAPNRILCNFSGYLFATSTLFSPLVAIIMAIDRAVAVYFHVWYKGHPYLKTKYAVLAVTLGTFGFYFTLPFYTTFGNYVAVPWLDVCSFEWGIEYRAFNLLLALVNTILLLILLAANIAIVVKIRKRQTQMKKMRSLHEKSKRSSVRRSIIKKLHKSADDILDMSAAEETPTSLQPAITPSPSVFRKRMSKSRPPPLNIPKIDKDSASEVTNSLSSKPRTNSGRFGRNTPTPTTTLTPPITPLPRAKTSSGSGRRPQASTPQTATSRLLTPPALDPLNPRPPSPLIFRNTNNEWPTPKKQKRLSTASRPRSLVRSSSADNILQTVFPAVSVSKPQTPTLLRQVLGYPGVKHADNDSGRFSAGTRSSDESDASKRRFFHSSTSSFFPFPFNARGSTRRSSEKRKKHRMVRKSASRITKMTTAICMVFVVLYLPFLIRKLIQVIPSTYNAIYVPEAIEIITLFGPFLSPLFNPIVYVFFNPHYRENCKQRYRKLRAKCPCVKKTRRLFSTSTFHISTPVGSIRRKPKTKKPSAELPSSNPRTEMPLSSQADDVFEEERKLSPDAVTKPLLRIKSEDVL
uniref:Prostaglandin F2-alpha receptor-like n=1 Tax=Phallusia mammillata TaxID=59560 RepID=A0A6F9DQT1_9ASCI|nr:prostaglandin F2-alpha receptor-like [Phallusia mammillata]